MRAAQLPDWLLGQLPDVRPHGCVDSCGSTALRYVAPDGSTLTFPDVASAYEALREVDLEFSADLVHREGARGGMITFPSGREEFLMAWMPRNDARDRERLEGDYRESMVWAERYRRDDAAAFLSAFRFIDTHPAFWIRCSGGANERSAWFWETSGHMRRVDLRVTSGEDGPVPDGRPVLVELETGMHVPDMTEHFHDPYLDAVGRTFEEAVLMLARNVALSFNDDGTETGAKPPNEWADEWIATIRSRVDNLETR